MRSIIIASAAVSFLAIAPIAYMAADNEPPYEYDAASSYIIPSHTPSGRQLTVHWRLKRVNRVCRGSVTRTIVDEVSGSRTTYDPTPSASNIEVGDVELDKSFYLPPNISPGPKVYYADSEYECNPLQHLYPLRVRTPRLHFEVVP